MNPQGSTDSFEYRAFSSPEDNFVSNYAAFSSPEDNFVSNYAAFSTSEENFKSHYADVASMQEILGRQNSDDSDGMQELHYNEDHSPYATIGDLQLAGGRGANRSHSVLRQGKGVPAPKHFPSLVGKGSSELLIRAPPSLPTNKRAKSERVGSPHTKSEFFKDLPETWSPKAVADYIESLCPAFKAYRDEIIKRSITGDIMQMLLTDHELLQEIGVDSTVHRFVISENVTKLFDETPDQGNSPLQWSCEEVADFVSNIAPVYKKYREAIVENGVNGKSMGVILQEKEYLGALGVKFAIHTKVIGANVRKLLSMWGMFPV